MRRWSDSAATTASLGMFVGVTLLIPGGSLPILTRERRSTNRRLRAELAHVRS
jgi:hypothetical protein